MKQISTLLAVGLVLGSVSVGSARAERIKDVARVGSVRSNQLIGYGLVVGLEGTGDSSGTQFTVQSTAAMLEKFGVTVPPGTIKVKNVAAVMVTANLPAFVRNGSQIDVQVSSLGDSSSLQGGTLLQTPLKAADGAVYAAAQGSVSVGGFSAGGAGGSQTKNHVTAGRVPGGALVEREVPTTLVSGNTLAITLAQPDFTSASRVADAINQSALHLVARAADSATVEVTLPAETSANPVSTIAQIEELSVSTDAVARVVVNERTGTVVIGGDVTVAPCAIAHGALIVKVSKSALVSQPNPLSKGGKTVVVPITKVDVKEDGGQVQALPKATSVAQVVKALNTLGVTPRDLIAILQALKGAGALKADLEIQ